MLSALPLHECADKAAADQRLQAMGALLVGGPWVCLQSINDGRRRAVTLLPPPPPKAEGSASIAHPRRTITISQPDSPGLTDPGMRAFALTNLLAPPEGGVKWQINLEGIRRYAGMCVCVLCFGDVGLRVCGAVVASLCALEGGAGLYPNHICIYLNTPTRRSLPQIAGFDVGAVDGEDDDGGKDSCEAVYPHKVGWEGWRGEGLVLLVV